MLIASVCFGLFAALSSSCSINHSIHHEAQRAAEVLSVEYSIVCVIHCDGDYLYHDTGGNEYYADEEVLAEAKMVAQNNPLAEMFIFHQKSKKHFLFFFPLRDGEFYYYRNGRLIANELYWRDQEQSHLDPEMDLYRRFHERTQRKPVSFFVYCGREIPEFGGTGYDASYPDRTFSVHDLADGLKGFTGDSAKIDLMVLSTCFGGTPYTIGTLGMYARYIIASPDILHLSYFDLYSLERLDLNMRDGNVHAFAKRFAQRAFSRLTRDIQTSVSVAVYDVDRVQEYLLSIRKAYDDTRTALKMETPASRAMIEHCDCANLPAYVLPTMNEGVNVFYRAARFGRSKHTRNHSGWECWREKEPQAAMYADP